MSREGSQTLAVKAKGTPARVPTIAKQITKTTIANRINPKTIIEATSEKRDGRIETLDNNLCMTSIELNRPIFKEISRKQIGTDMRENLDKTCRGQVKIQVKE